VGIQGYHKQHSAEDYSSMFALLVVVAVAVLAAAGHIAQDRYSLHTGLFVHMAVAAVVVCQVKVACLPVPRRRQRQLVPVVAKLSLVVVDEFESEMVDHSDRMLLPRLQTLVKVVFGGLAEMRHNFLCLRHKITVDPTVDCPRSACLLDEEVLQVQVYPEDEGFYWPRPLQVFVVGEHFESP
jgi:hypothetical protein